MRKRISLEARLAGLEALSMAELREAFFRLSGQHASKRHSRAGLEAMVACQLQEKLIARLQLKMSRAFIAASEILDLLTSSSEQISEASRQVSGSSCHASG